MQENAASSAAFAAANAASQPVVAPSPGAGVTADGRYRHRALTAVARMRSLVSGSVVYSSLG